ncbi:hypothetical protein SAY87_025685 [Trapa incisa]|uniref:Uncharacterized protein n=1 Tax=Trapa incisa TaxID=236973 RepID=A0AAN7JKM9_9MYRT|nr:hypothetical protein SAY87_025685 [Trapa incisa]
MEDQEIDQGIRICQGQWHKHDTSCIGCYYFCSAEARAVQEDRQSAQHRLKLYPILNPDHAETELAVQCRDPSDPPPHIDHKHFNDDFCQQEIRGQPKFQTFTMKKI